MRLSPRNTIRAREASGSGCGRTAAPVAGRTSESGRGDSDSEHPATTTVSVVRNAHRTLASLPDRSNAISSHCTPATFTIPLPRQQVGHYLYTSYPPRGCRYDALNSRTSSCGARTRARSRSCEVSDALAPLRGPQSGRRIGGSRRVGGSVAAPRRPQPGRDRPRKTSRYDSRAHRRRDAVDAVAAARPGGLCPRRQVTSHRVARACAQARGSRP